MNRYQITIDMQQTDTFSYPVYSFVGSEWVALLLAERYMGFSNVNAVCVMNTETGEIVFDCRK